jgi:hypothetical protein
LAAAVDPRADGEKGPGAKAKLEELKSRLPAVLKRWAKEDQSLPVPYTLELRVCRRTAPDQAKLSILCNPEGKAARQMQGEVVNAFLSYHDGSWTTTRFEASGAWGDPRFNRSAFSLMLAVDEANGIER